MSKAESGNREELQSLAALPDEAVDTSDIPEVSEFEGSVRGRFFRPLKKSVTIRLDADVLEYLRAIGPGYQTRINSILRDYMAARARSA
ncbi:hypothetical protein NNJEOMEG_00360 [Fundidesulfovibrio magnetotacticus]|uniref:BrnA antitoxin of type II toxin-antitoxin system n=1 Tax=Fundidesulfovibrio magnetotacticus TaxID=2730080 RepID=A0A6V8LW84_9BACT|nr:BrnA antitoxin family protein [Fundidesulfovibrio magnetotacticus]GFK92535.1 hypothetical protein NNJEOMEG_00360 [Fundidesulfovibrio magnetotacticus]